MTQAPGISIISFDSWSLQPLHRALIATVCALLLGCSPGDPDELLREADKALGEGDPRTALIHLRNALKSDPENAEALIRLGSLYTLAGDARSADRFFRTAARFGADVSRFRPEWLSAQLQAGRYQELLDGTNPLPADMAAQDVLSLRGYAQQALGQLLQAEESFRKAVAAAPEQPDAAIDLAQLLLFMDRDEEADSQIATALALNPDFPPALVLRGTREFAAGETDQAKASLLRAAELARSDAGAGTWVSALSGLAELHLYLGELEAASTVIEDAADVVGESLQVRYLRAELAAQRGDVQSAQTYLQAILGDYPEHAPSQRLLGSIYALEGSLNLAELYLKMAVNSDARDTIARGLLATVRVRQDRADEAVELLDDVGPLLDAGQQAGFLALAGQANLQAGNVDRALEIFGAGASEYPDDWRFALGQALAYLRALRTDEAILLLESIDEQAAPEVRGTTLVLSYVQKGDFERADAEARRLAKIHPEAAWAQNLLGSWLLQQRDYAAAALAYAQSYRLEPSPESAAGAAEARSRGGISRPTGLLEDWLARNPGDLATLHALGQVTLALNDFEASKTFYEQVVEQDPEHVGALNNLAWIYLQLNNDRSLEFGQRAYRLARRNAAVADTLGWAQLRFGQTARARETLTQALSLAPSDPEIAYHQAVALARNGDTAAARERLEALTNSGLDFPSLAAAREELARL